MMPPCKPWLPSPSGTPSPPPRPPIGAAQYFTEAGHGGNLPSTGMQREGKENPPCVPGGIDSVEGEEQ